MGQGVVQQALARHYPKAVVARVLPILGLKLLGLSMSVDDKLNDVLVGLGEMASKLASCILTA